MTLSSNDITLLRLALELAEQGRGWVEPNPLVGAVVVRDGEVVGKGWHAKFGGAHAEVVALQAAGQRAREATLYVSLEPCCHHGKTPPCTEAILAAGIRRVVAAMTDPFPEVAGKGLEALRQAGIEVQGAAAESELGRAARRLNAPYLKLLATGLPYVQAKWAMTLDGKIATARGESKWISGEPARRWVHELRGKVDAIIVGAETVRSDDPRLTARPPGPRMAARIVLDSQARLGIDSQLVRTATEAPVMVACTRASAADDLRRLEAAGCECLMLDDQLSPHAQGSEIRDRGSARPNAVSSLGAPPGRTSILALLEELGRRHMTNVLVEGGAEVLGSFFDAGQIDVAHVLIAPKLIGGHASKTPIAGTGIQELARAAQLEIRETTAMGQDVYVRAEKTVAGSFTVATCSAAPLPSWAQTGRG